MRNKTAWGDANSAINQVQSDRIEHNLLKVMNWKQII